MEIKVYFEGEVHVEFSDPVKAKALFVDGDWKETFYILDDLEEVAQVIAHNFFMGGGYHKDGDMAQFIEGFGEFVSTDHIHYVYRDPEFGAIVVWVESDVEPVSTEVQ